jgi:hypothetical protein
MAYTFGVEISHIRDARPSSTSPTHLDIRDRTPPSRESASSRWDRSRRPSARRSKVWDCSTPVRRERGGVFSARAGRSTEARRAARCDGSTLVPRERFGTWGLHRSSCHRFHHAVPDSTQHRTSRHVRRRATLKFEFWLYSPPRTAYTLCKIKEIRH